MDENKKSLEATEIEEKVAEGTPVESEILPIEEAAPPKANAEHSPADVAPEALGREDDGPANAYADMEKGMNAATGAKDESPKAKAGESDFMSKVWRPFLWPIVTLVVICAVATGLLAVTNEITAPLIAANEASGNAKVRNEVLPEANGDFEEIELGEEFAGVSSMMRATNGAGYVIEASASGYNGAVPAMVALDESGTILAVRFLDNDETPGLGSRIGDEGFYSQFAGLSGNVGGEVDAISGATISSGAAVSAVNNAIDAFNAVVLGVEVVAETDDDIRAALLPEADGFEQVEAEGEGVLEAYRATNDAGYVITTYAAGYGGDVPTMVAFDASGAVVGVRFLDNDETPGLGTQIMDAAFEEQFAGFNEAIGEDDIDMIAGATLSSGAALSAVNKAIEFYTAEILGVEAEPQAAVDEATRAALLPDAGEVTELDVDGIEGIAEAWAGDDGSFIIVGEARGLYNTPLLSALALDENGTITAMWIDASGETKGYGREMDEDEAFKGQFIGRTDTDGIDTIAEVTVSSEAAIEAAQNALDAFDQVKEVG